MESGNTKRQAGLATDLSIFFFRLLLDRLRHSAVEFSWNTSSVCLELVGCCNLGLMVQILNLKRL